MICDPGRPILVRIGSPNAVVLPDFLLYSSKVDIQITRQTQLAFIGHQWRMVLNSTMLTNDMIKTDVDAFDFGISLFIDASLKMTHNMVVVMTWEKSKMKHPLCIDGTCSINLSNKRSWKSTKPGRGYIVNEKCQQKMHFSKVHYVYVCLNPKTRHIIKVHTIIFIIVDCFWIYASSWSASSSSPSSSTTASCLSWYLPS